MSDKDNIEVDYSEHYSEEDFWSKLTKYAIKAGRKCVEMALQLWSKLKGFWSKRFWSKLTKHAIKAGRKCVEKALQLYYAFESPETPNWAKTVIISVLKKGKRKSSETPSWASWAKVVIIAALGYFIFPLDVILDFLPGGYVEDYGVILLAVATVNKYITDEMKDKAKCKAGEWFGEEEEEDKKRRINLISKISDL